MARGHNAGWGFSGDGAFVGFEGSVVYMSNEDVHWLCRVDSG